MHTPHPWARLRASSAVPRGLIRALWDDPVRAPERLVVTAVGQLRDESREFAVAIREDQPDATVAELCEAERRRVLTISRIDGAIAGTPFLIALVPAYVAFLWEQVRMVLRIAALNGRDLGAVDLAAEILWLRGVHSTVAAAHAAIGELDAEHEKRFEGGARGVYELGKRLLVLIGLLGEPKPDDETVPAWRRNLILGVVLAFGAATWVLTWFFPVTLMLLIAYSCDGSTRRLGARAIEHYARGASGAVTPGQRWYRPRLIAVLLALTVAVPLVLLAFAVGNGDQFIGTRRLLVGLLGLAVVLAMSGWVRLAGRRTSRDRPYTG